MKNGVQISRRLPVDSFGPVGPAVGRYRNIAPNVRMPGWDEDQSSRYYFVDEPTDKYADVAEYAMSRSRPWRKHDMAGCCGGYGAVSEESKNLLVTLAFIGLAGLVIYWMVK